MISSVRLTFLAKMLFTIFWLFFCKPDVIDIFPKSLIPFFFHWTYALSYLEYNIQFNTVVLLVLFKPSTHY